MTRTKFGTEAAEFAQALASGPPYSVRYQWGGSGDAREERIVNEAIAACFGAKTLGPEQEIRDGDPNLGPLADRVRYAFWLLRIFGLSLGFTHGEGTVCRISIRVDRSRYREEYDES